MKKTLIIVLGITSMISISCREIESDKRMNSFSDDQQLQNRNSNNFSNLIIKDSLNIEETQPEHPPKK